MQVTKTFYISISKKYTEIEVYGFLMDVSLDDHLDFDDLGTRHNVSSRAINSALFPKEYRDSNFYWVSSVCIS